VRGRPSRQESLKALDKIANVGMEPRDVVHGDLNTSIAKRWLNGEVALHAHLRVRPRLGESHPQDLCHAFIRNCLVNPVFV
jgi:hypothetical protein